jgi:hypothetical protein
MTWNRERSVIAFKVSKVSIEQWSALAEFRIDLHSLSLTCRGSEVKRKAL